MNQISLITFRVANQLLALPIDKVREIIRKVATAAAPTWTGLLHGIINLRGMVIPVLDLRLILTEKTPDDTRKTRIIIVEMLERAAGLIVDQVDDIVPLSQDNVVPISAVSWAKRSAVLAAVAKIEGRMYLVLDIDRLVHEEECNIFKEICLRIDSPEQALSR